MVPPHRNVPEPTEPPPTGIRKPAPPPTAMIGGGGYGGVFVGVAICLAVIAAFVLGRVW